MSGEYTFTHQINKLKMGKGVKLELILVMIFLSRNSFSQTKELRSEKTKTDKVTETYLDLVLNVVISISIQKEIFSWMLKRKMQGKMSQEIQDVVTTIAILKNAGYPENTLTTAQLCEVLGVDGIRTSNFGLSKPLSTGAAIAEAFLSDSRSSTNEVHASLSISDYKNNKLIWNYNYKSSGSLGSTSSKLVDNLMREASQKRPYMN